MSSLAPITAHAAQAQGRLLEQLRNRPNMTGLIGALCSAVQLIEGQAFAVLNGRYLVGNQAVGAQLDGIGQIVGISRNGLTDAQYLVFIYGAIARNSSRADNETLLTIVRLVFQATAAHIIGSYSPGWSHRLFPAVIGIEVGLPAIPPNMVTAAVALLTASLGATVAISWISAYDPVNSFALAGPSSGMGLGDANVPGSGGTLASLLASF